MEFHLLEPEFTPDVDKLLAKLGLSEKSDEQDDFLALLDQARAVVKPKAAIGLAKVEIVDPKSEVKLNGIQFSSTLLASNLKDIEVAWPYVATCGRELYDFVQAIPDPFERFWGDEIMQQGLTIARAAMENFLVENIYQGKTAFMSPGSLPDWPIMQQFPMFKLMHDATERCGITLTDTMLMLPNKSVSGVRFPNEHGYVNCRLCPKPNCPNRRAKYDEDVAKACL